MSDATLERTALPTVYQWQADAIESAAKHVAFWVSTTPEDKLGWAPKLEGYEAKGRSVYEQIHECAQVNRRFAGVLKGETLGPWVEEYTYTSSQEAQDDLRASAKLLADQVRQLDDEALTREYPTARGSMTGAALMSISVVNMNYHGGQINQLQMLLGDSEFRFPPQE